MRVHQSADSRAFSEWLLYIGHGRSSDGTHRSPSVSIPPHMLCASENDLIDAVYGSIEQCHVPISFNAVPFSHRQTRTFEN